MSMALSFLAPLAAVTLAAPESVAPESAVVPADAAVFTDAELERQSWRFAKVLVDSYACDLLGYEVDYEGLADWGWETHLRLVDAGASDEEALARIRNDVGVHRMRFNSFHGQVVPLSFRGNAALIGLSNDEALYRFKKTFGDRCDDLIDSSDAGAFFEPPEERMSGQELVRKLRDMVWAARERRAAS